MRADILDVLHIKRFSRVTLRKSELSPDYWTENMRY